ncbi:MmgE/PrpD family protein [Amycolatopsis sp. FDAARGOS 1241]|uniref:MmgE/PrpD family protein n=1 Tax=Amycolatopsis sp. FDAARGOS 1241 TaxID=2778070 RepID=UPI00194F5674|nr:MmgE/PrpD family protein [Amycolatopsis sp. FDAARGOS 1241]QRP43663.1 MmgE/PrpD family protein [Amycolatopsis sp. FDAARGOS 1241]
MSLVGELAARAHSVAAAAVPPAVRAAVRAHLTDAVGALVAGRTTLGGSVAGLARTLSPEFGAARRTAFVGGVYAHAWEAGDIHRGSVLCPGCVVLPATLAVLPARPGASADEFERAYLAGYEVALAAAAAIGGDRQIRRGWWPTALLAPLGGAAAASVLLDRPPEVTASAIALAAQHAGGSIAGATDRADGKYLLAGFAAERAITAFLAADSGWTGPLDILDDPRSPLRREHPGLPEPYLTPETSLKPHAGAKHLQGAIDAVLELRRAGGWRPGEVRRLTCLLPAQLAGIVDRPPPFGSPLSALGSAQFVLAIAAIRGHCTPWDFEEAALRDDAVLELARVVRVAPADDLTAAYPAKWGARVELTTASGVVAADRLDARGDPGNRLAHHEIVAKFTTLARRELGPVRARAVAESLLRPGSGVSALREHVLPLLGGSFVRWEENAAAGARTGGSS